MKVKKIRVTEKNIDMLVGLINKYFKSFDIKDGTGTEYDYENWKHRQSGLYTFFSGHCTLVKIYERCYHDLDKVEVVQLEKPVKMIRIEYPVISSIKIGDYIHLDGNHFMYGNDGSMYQKMYARNIKR